MGSKGSNTTTTSQQASPEAMATYRALLDRASEVASQPYTPYGGDLSAGFNPQQNMGAAGINQNAGFALPFLQSAQGYATQAGAPITGDDIARYQNPYTQQVVDATQAHFDRQNAGQQNDLRSRAAMAGALGGSSPRIAAADMAYQQQQGQAPAIAGLYRQGFDTALSAAQRQQQQAGQTAGLMGNLGISGQQAMLSGAGAQFGVGQAEQTTQQQDLDRQYQQFQIQQAFPYQQTQWLAGIGTGVGSQMGGTGTTTAPRPSPFGQIAGLGLAGAGMFFNHGGRIRGFAPGGAIDATPYASAQGWIPQIGITRGSGPPSPPRPPAEEKQPDYLKGIAGFAKRPQDAGSPLVNYNPVQDVSNPHYAMGPELPPYYQTPGLRPIYRDGGRIAGFAEGGVPDDDPSFSDRWFPTIDAVRTGEFDVGGANYTPLYEASVGPTAGVDVPMPRPRPAGMGVGAGPGPMEGPALGFSGPAGASGDDLGSEGAAAYFPSLPEARAGVAGPSQAPQQGQRGGLGFIPEEYRMPLITAGLAMMASRSPHALSAIGEGGLAGVGAYSRQKQAQADADYNQRKFNLDARRLDQAAERAREDLALRTKALGETTRYHNIIDENRKDANARESLKPTGALTEEGHPILYDARRPGVAIDAITGKPIEAGQKVVAPKSEGLLSDSAVDVGARQMAAGDLSPLTNVGRGAQGSTNLAKLRNKAIDVLVTEHGMPPEQAAKHMSTQLQAFKSAGIGQSAEARTAGTREANLKIILAATAGAIPAALEASEKVSRTGWVPLNQIIQRGQVVSSDPELREFGMANLQLAEHWARAMNPTGVMRESDRELALHFLTTTDSKETYKRAVLQLDKQIKRELTAVQSHSARTPSGPGAPASPSTETPKVGDRKQFKQGVGIWDGTKYAPEKP